MKYKKSDLKKIAFIFLVFSLQQPKPICFPSVMIVFLHGIAGQPRPGIPMQGPPIMSGGAPPPRMMTGLMPPGMPPRGPDPRMVPPMRQGMPPGPGIQL